MQNALKEPCAVLRSAQVHNCWITASCPAFSYKVSTHSNLSELTLPVCCYISIPVKLCFGLICRTPLISGARMRAAYSS